MSFLSSCCGQRGKHRLPDEEALLAEYDDDTVLQRRLHQKMHSYQMVRAMAAGFMPSTEQLIVNLRTLIASDLLNPDNPELSESGRRLVRHTKQWLKDFVELLRNKNSKDQIQDFVWFLSKTRVSVDTKAAADRAAKIRKKADATAAYESLRTVGSLLLTNSDFRLFLGDLNTIGREVFSDTAFSLSRTAEEAGKKLEPSEDQKKTLEGPGADKGSPPTQEDLGSNAVEVSKVVREELTKTGADAVESAKEHFSGDERQTLLHRLKEAVTKLRKRNDYSDSVNTLVLLIQRYVNAYSQAADKTLTAAQKDVHANEELDRAMRNGWSLISSFGERDQWEELRRKFEKLLEHANRDPEFEDAVKEVGNSLQQMLTDPEFFDKADERVDELKEKTEKASKESTLRQDVDALLVQSRKTLQSVAQDKDIASLIGSSSHIISILFPSDSKTNPDLLSDALQVFVPLAIRMIQYVPIPRIEVSVPALDLLLENLILEPGESINGTSFLPHRLRIETRNDVEVRAARFRTAATTTTRMRIRLNGLCIRADELGFWIRTHPSMSLLRFADEGIASFRLDGKGVDIVLDVELGPGTGPDRPEREADTLLSLRGVSVRVNRFSYELRRSKLSWLAWLLGPVLRPALRKTLETQLASAIGDLLRAANRELVFARERLRATRVADPHDLLTFLKAVAARLVPEEDPDVYTAVGVFPSKHDVFKGVYAPGSLVQVWEEEARKARDRVEDVRADGWRNEIFDVQTVGSG